MPGTVTPRGNSVIFVPKKTVVTAISTNDSAPVTAMIPPMPSMARKTSTMGLNATSNGACENEMSQWRRGTPKLPANVMPNSSSSSPPANRYGCQRASGQKATFLRKISGSR